MLGLQTAQTGSPTALTRISLAIKTNKAPKLQFQFQIQPEPSSLFSWQTGRQLSFIKARPKLSPDMD